MSFAQDRTISKFDKIAVSGNVSIEMIKGDSPILEYKMIAGSENDLYTEVENGKLVVKIKSNLFKKMGKKVQAKVTVYYQNVASIECKNGASFMMKDRTVSNDMNIRIKNGAAAHINLDSETVNAIVSTGSSLRLLGSANEINLKASTGSSIDAYKVESDKANVKSSTGSAIKVNVNKNLKADASTGGTIKYKGEVEDYQGSKRRSGQISRG